MTWLAARYEYLFRSTRGLALVAIAMVSLTAVVFGTLSGPMAELGLKDVAVRVFGFRLDPAEREGRIIVLYHSIAVAVVAVETYFITSLFPLRPGERSSVNATITVGYLVTMVFGLAFAYFGHEYVFHGLYIFGLSISFFGGVLLARALWPWRAEYRTADQTRARTRGGLDLERVALFTMAVATLGSACFGAVAGSYYGRGFDTFLAENVVREPHKSVLQLAVIGHLHIMLTLIAVALVLIVGRWLDFRGPLHKVAMPLLIAGTVIVTLGVWLVVPFETQAHTLIYVGSVPMLAAALLLVVYGWRKLIRERLAEQRVASPTLGQRVAALLHDPVRFGPLWQMVYMNFVVTAVGIFMAIRLDKTVRTWPWREERITLTGHWHILAGIIATIILLYYADLIGLKGRTRRWFGWGIIVCSDVAFAAVTLFSTKRLYVGEDNQQTLVKWTMIATDLGLALVLVMVGVFLIWRLVDLFRARGRWADDLGAEAPGAEAAR